MSDIYQTITDRIVAQIEAGAGAWELPWRKRQGSAQPLAQPRNISGRAYRGGNTLMLWAAAEAFGYPHPVWGTYKQWSERGCQVRKGEKSTMIVFWKQMPGKPRLTEGEDGGEDEGGKPYLMARGYFVFNAAQVEGFEPTMVGKTATPADLPEDERIAAADGFFAALGATLHHGGERAFYQPSGDLIRMPEFGQFKSAVGYYAVLAHEHVHWTGAKHRLNREFGARFGDQAYAFEELVAELGAAFMCAHLGLANEPRPDHARYIASWIEVLRHDKRAIFTAASKAQAAADWLIAAAAEVPAALAAA